MAGEGIQFVEIVETNPDWIKVRGSDGEIYTLTGSRNWRNNNPGNIKNSAFAKQSGSIGSDGKFAVFPTVEAGLAAQQKLLFQDPRYAGLTVKEAIAKYAPKSDSNDPDRYARFVANTAGVTTDTALADLAPEQRAELIRGMVKFEGFRPGQIASDSGVVPKTVASQFSRVDPVGDGAAIMTASAPMPGADIPFGSAADAEDFETFYNSIKGQSNLVSSGRKKVSGDPATAAWQSNNLATINVGQNADGQPLVVRVLKEAEPNFRGFLADLQASGYDIRNLGSQVVRNKRGKNSLSEHSFGTAIDVNGEIVDGEDGPRNAFSSKLITDLPDDISQMAAKWGLSWGGDWSGNKDAMHFEYTGAPPYTGALPSNIATRYPTPVPGGAPAVDPLQAIERLVAQDEGGYAVPADMVPLPEVASAFAPSAGGSPVVPGAMSPAPMPQVSAPEVPGLVPAPMPTLQEKQAITSMAGVQVPGAPLPRPDPRAGQVTGNGGNDTLGGGIVDRLRAAMGARPEGPAGGMPAAPRVPPTELDQQVLTEWMGGGFKPLLGHPTAAPQVPGAFRPPNRPELAPLMSGQPMAQQAAPLVLSRDPAGTAAVQAAPLGDGVNNRFDGLSHNTSDGVAIPTGKSPGPTLQPLPTTKTIVADDDPLDVLLRTRAERLKNVSPELVTTKNVVPKDVMGAPSPLAAKSFSTAPVKPSDKFELDAIIEKRVAKVVGNQVQDQKAEQLAMRGASKPSTDPRLIKDTDMIVKSSITPPSVPGAPRPPSSADANAQAAQDAVRATIDAAKKRALGAPAVGKDELARMESIMDAVGDGPVAQDLRKSVSGGTGVRVPGAVPYKATIRPSKFFEVPKTGGPTPVKDIIKQIDNPLVRRFGEANVEIGARDAAGVPQKGYPFLKLLAGLGQMFGGGDGTQVATSRSVRVPGSDPVSVAQRAWVAAGGVRTGEPPPLSVYNPNAGNGYDAGDQRNYLDPNSH